MIIGSIDGIVSGWTKFMLSFQIAMAMRRNQKVFPIVIDSPGGSITTMRYLTDILRASNMEIVTICSGLAASAASVILSLGQNKRIGFPSCEVVIHEARGMLGMETILKASDAKAIGERYTKMTDDAYAILDNAARKSSGYFQDLVYKNGNADTSLWAEDAKRHGLLTEIKVPNLRDIFGNIEELQPSPSGYDYGQQLVLSVAQEQKTALMMAFKKEYEALMASEDLPDQYLDKSFIENNILKMEDYPFMCVKSIGNVDMDGAGKGGNSSSQPSASGATPPPLPTPGATMTMEQVQVMLANQATTFENKLNDVFLRGKQDGRQEAETELKPQIDSLNEKVNLVSADALTAKQEKELVEMRAWTRDMYENKNKITRAEMSTMEDYMLKHTKVEDGSRKAYMDAQEQRAELPKMAKLGLLPDSPDLQFNEHEKTLLSSGASREGVITLAEMRKYITDNKLDDKNPDHVSQARKYALDKYPKVWAK
jgi:ATP-dependent protease ClpP protease subunit